MAKIYNKLVRDKIPEIIEKDGKILKIRILNDEEYKKELKNKLIEEANEAILAENNADLSKEIGDILEVVESIEKAFNLNKEEIIKLKKERKQNRGGFEKKIFLEEIE
ncbi:MAG: nucleoside triphosphate pyrophosphohydrolase [Patescibacteria group bacterium]